MHSNSVNNKSRNLNKGKILIIFSFVLLFVLGIRIVNVIFNKEVIENNEKETNEVQNKPYAMYINNGNGYEEYKKEEFPKGYELNKEKSVCEDINGNKLDEIKNNIVQDGNKITVKSDKTMYCTLYFDKVEITDNIKFYVKAEGEDK